MEFAEQVHTESMSTDNDLVLITERIDVLSTIQSVKDDAAGAISTFMGTTRDNFEGLFYETTLVCTFLSYKMHREKGNVIGI